jgi:inhibitor of cysteine peptidase
MFENSWHKRGRFAVVFMLLASLAAVAVAGCASADASRGPLALGETDNGKSFTVNVGDTVTIAIPGNPTTGYSWVAALSDKDTALLEQQGDPTYLGDSADNVVGAGGTFTFTFKATAAGRAALKLAYVRPWEPDAPAQTYEVQVTIK